MEFHSTKNYLSENAQMTLEQFEEESSDDFCQKNCCSCFNQWWNVRFRHQRFIVHIVEKTIFHVAIVILVLIDCILVVGELMLDFMLAGKCDEKTQNSTHHGKENKNHKLELAAEILHYGSIVLLGFFVLEVLLKVYAFGKKWWNFREKKMEWLDAIIVIVSFTIDLYFLKNSNVIAEISLLFISFRLWRIIRIINSVAQSIRSQDESSKKHLANIYLQIIESLLTVSGKKTDVALELRNDLTKENFDQIIEKFQSIDQICRSILTHCQKPSSRNAAHVLAQNLQEALEKIRLTSTTLGLNNPNDNHK